MGISAGGENPLGEFHLTQFCTINPGTLLNSRSLFVTNMQEANIHRTAVSRGFAGLTLSRSHETGFFRRNHFSIHNPDTPSRIEQQPDADL